MKVEKSLLVEENYVLNVFSCVSKLSGKGFPSCRLKESYFFFKLVGYFIIEGFENVINCKAKTGPTDSITETRLVH